MDLIPADILKDRFVVSARFYHSNVNGMSYLMRREARIIRRGADQNEIDAVLVMLNPGSCAPEYPMQYTKLEDSGLVLASPDQTQYQLMNLMERMRWSQIAIVNLSDLCEGNSTEFEKIIKSFKAAKVAHSIFQDGNYEEYLSILEQSETIIFAWGSSVTAKHLSKEFDLFINGEPSQRYKEALALVHETKKYPRHPKPALIPDKLQWLEEMTLLINEKKADLYI